MTKPTYSQYVTGVQDYSSIGGAEQELDRQKDRYSEAMKTWWSSLSVQEKIDAYKEDSNISFHVDLNEIYK